MIYIFSYAFGNGLAYLTPVRNAWLWFPDKAGLCSGIILSGFGLSELIFNNIAFELVNPDNLSADADGKFPDSVNERVPRMIQILAAIYLVMTLIAVTCIFQGPLPDQVLVLES